MNKLIMAGAGIVMLLYLGLFLVLFAPVLLWDWLRRRARRQRPA